MFEFVGVSIVQSVLAKTILAMQRHGQNVKVSKLLVPTYLPTYVGLRVNEGLGTGGHSAPDYIGRAPPTVAAKPLETLIFRDNF